MINGSIFIHDPMSSNGIPGWIPQIKIKTFTRPHHSFPCTRTPNHIPNPAPLSPIPNSGSPPPPYLPQNPPPNVAVPVAPPSSAAEPEASCFRQVKWVEIVQVYLFNYIYAMIIGAVVFRSEVVADELLFGRVESGTWWERKRRRIMRGFHHILLPH